MNRDPTTFERSVYAACSMVPRGKVSSYKAIADYVGCNSCRAIGQALRRNPYAPRVPCHRIVASDLTIGGFAGKLVGDEIAKKKRLLKEEGVLFRNGQLSDETRFYDFEDAD